jgi:protein-tyrosine phosphatase
MKILMVCLGNICRSPLAQGILEHNANILNKHVEVDSAATSNFHVGDLPDSRSISTAYLHGIDITSQRGRQFNKSDFDTFDIIFVMDSSNYQNILVLAETEEHRKKVKLIMNEMEPVKNINVPDPYYGGNEGFEQVFTMLDKATKAFLEKI